MRVESASGATVGGSSLSAGKLGKDFMQLLVTQLQHQDPLQPLEDRELVSQLAQLSSLDALERIEAALTGGQGAEQLAHAVALIGQVVEARGSVSGKVSAAGIGADGQVFLTVGSQTVPLSEVTQVKAE